MWPPTSSSLETDDDQDDDSDLSDSSDSDSGSGCRKLDSLELMDDSELDFVTQSTLQPESAADSHGPTGKNATTYIHK